MKIKKNLLLVFALSFLATSCNNNNESTPNSSSQDDSLSTSESNPEISSSTIDSSLSSSDESSSLQEPIETTYIDKKISPDYPQISEDIAYTTYYIDSIDGNDANDGLSSEYAKKSLTAANSIVKSTKDNRPTKILFKAGSSYEGNLMLSDFTANENSPLIVSTYGGNETLTMASIIGPENGTCIDIKNSNVRVSNLECSSPRGFRGIHVNTTKKGVMKNIVIKNCYIHDINFDQSMAKLPEGNEMPDSTSVQMICPDSRFSYSCGGIIFEANTSLAKGPSWYENIWIDNNTVERVTRTGIWIFSNWAQRPGIDWGSNPYYDDDTNWYPHKNVYIRNNDVLFSGGDGIIMGACLDSFIEGNYCYNAQILGRPNYYCAGIWSHSCKNLVFQFNEASYTHTKRDGQGFDIDIGNSNILFQYNYSHHNDGGGLLCCNTATNLVKYTKDGEMILDEDGLPVTEKIMAPWHDILVKNNIFADNDTADFILSGTVNDVNFENNTVIKAGEIANERIFDTKDFYTGIPGTNWNFSNNIFYLRKANLARFNMSFSEEYTFDNNIYYGFDDTFKEEMKEYGEKNYIEINPDFANPIAGDGYNNVYNFIPRESKIFTGANTLANMLKYDLLGNDVTGKQYYGAYGTNG